MNHPNSMRDELVIESARTAEWKLRAEQLADQHRMQGNLLKEVQDQRQLLADALGECLVASGIVASNASGFSGPQLLMFAEDLKGQLSAIGAGGVEPLRKRDDSEDEGDYAGEWRRLALQFDEHRMLALWHLRRLVRIDDGYPEAKEAQQFLAAPSLPGEAVLAQRIAELAATQPSLERLQQSGGSSVYPPLPMSKARHAADGQSACWDAEEMRAYVDADRAAYAAAAATLDPPAENLRCKSVQKRLATMWGYVPAQEHATQLAGQALPADEFRGDTASLVRNIIALLDLDAQGCLVPHGVGGHARGLLSAAASRLAAPAQAQEDAPDAVRALIATHAEMLEDSAHAYFELAYTRQTGWMAWITDKPLYGAPVVNPDRKVLAQGQGDTPDEACADAARAAKGGAA